ncbi:MAG: hypothetical protein IPL39_21725 [Opitutaceae bacterium]|nr:hypothetical protein [Opitutaceae bacterium]
MDIPVVGVGIARDGLTATTAEFRRAYIQLGSTMEHSVIEQNYPGMSAVSTVRYVRENNLAGGKTFYATSANYPTIAADPAFIAGWSATWRNTHLPNVIAAGATLVLPQSGAITMGSLTGNGYFEIYASSITAKINPGLLNGGYANQPGTADATKNSTPNKDTNKPDGLDNKESPDPIDLYNGAYVADQIDLALGSGGARGLSLSRHYSSSGDAGPSGFGRGWSHNFGSSGFVVADRGGCGKRGDA